MTPPVVRRLGPADLPEAARVLAAAFADDPLWVVLAPDPERRARLLVRIYGLILAGAVDARRAHGVGYPLAAVAVWAHPADPPGGTRAAARQILASAPLVSSARSLVRALAVQRGFEAMRRIHAPDAHLHLEHVGVHPDARGQGLAGALVRPVIERARAVGIPAWTETVTPGNVSLYEHLGFGVAASSEVPVLGLRLWGFRRPAAER